MSCVSVYTRCTPETTLVPSRGLSAMPIPILGHALFKGVSETALLPTILKFFAAFAISWVIKRFFQGAANLSERNMHGKVVIVTVSVRISIVFVVLTSRQGGTSGIGAEVVRGLASRGAQIVLLTQHELGDPFLVDYIEDVRAQANNELVTAEQVDLSSLHSIRTFATKWIDNAPPRRLDMIVLCGNVTLPSGSKLQSTADGLEISWAVNYLANAQLLNILSPAIRAQPPDRDVRILVGTCISYLAGQLPDSVRNNEGDDKESSNKMSKTQQRVRFSASSAYASSKLAVMTFAQAFQTQLDAYKRPDGQPNNARVILVEPGFTRTPGMHRYLTWGSLFGLTLYVICYPFWWFVLKSPFMGAQNFLHAAMEAKYGQGVGGLMIRECREITVTRQELRDEAIQKALLKHTDATISEAEKRSAAARAQRKATDAKSAAPATNATRTKTKST